MDTKALKEWTPADIIACAKDLLNAHELNILTVTSITGALLAVLPDPISFLVSAGVSFESATALWKKISNGSLMFAVSRVEQEIAKFQGPGTPQKRPTNSVLAVWQRIEDPESPKRVTKLMAAGLDRRERMATVLKLQTQLMPAVNAVRPPLAELNLAPLRDRDEQLTKAATLFQLNCKSYTRTTEHKNAHLFLTVTAGTGFGKTRFCSELGRLLQNTELTVRQKVIKKKIVVELDFSNGDGPHEDISTARYNQMLDEEKSSLANEFLGKRIAAHGLFDCKFKMMKAVLDGKELLDLQKTLQFADVMAAIAHKYGATEDEPIGMLLILDEINHLFEYEGLAKSIIALVGSFMNDHPAKAMQQQVGIVLFPVIAGTAIHGVESIFQASDYGNMNISLGLLSLASAKDIFQACLPELAGAVYDKRMARLLLLYGNTPSILMLIISLAADNLLEDTAWRTLINLVEVKTNEFSTKYQLPSLGLSHVDVVLSGIEATTNTKALFRPIEKEGLVYITNKCFMLPYVYLKSANLECKAVPADMLPSPGQQYSWSNFEHLEHCLQPIRARTQLKLKNTSKFQLEIMFPKDSASRTILELEVVLKVLSPCTCQSKLLVETTDQLSLDEIETQTGRKKPSQFTSYTFLPGPGNALFDILEFYKKVTGRPIALFKQMQHLSNTENSATIGPEPIEEWLRKMRHATVNLSHTYLCLFMLITNKKVPQRLSLVETHEDLIIIDSAMLLQYYGPTVALFADLIAFDEAKTLVENNKTL